MKIRKVNSNFWSTISKLNGQGNNNGNYYLGQAASIPSSAFSRLYINQSIKSEKSVFYFNPA